MRKILSTLGLFTGLFTLSLATPALAQQAPAVPVAAQPSAPPEAVHSTAAKPAAKPASSKAGKKGHKHQGRKGGKHHKGGIIKAAK